MPNPLRRLFRLATDKSRREADLASELDLHLALAEEELRTQGLGPDEARRRAAARFGDRQAVATAVRAIDRAGERASRRTETVDKWRSDARLAIRGFRRSPWVAVAAVGLIALGIGANVAVFSLVNAAFLRPLPYPDADRIVTVAESRRGRRMQVAGQNFRDWHTSNRVFDHLALYQHWTTVVSGTETPRTIAVGVVSAQFAAALGVAPIAGRWFTTEEARLDGPPAVVVSEHYWRSRLGASPAAIGTVLQIDGSPAPIVGVMPAAFDLPLGAEVWFPAEPFDDSSSRTAHNWRVIGRLKTGVSTAEATRSLTLLTQQLVADLPANDFTADGAIVIPLREGLLGESPTVLRLLSAAVGLLLLVATLNLTALLLARAAERQDEVVMVLTLGATRADLARRFVVESLLLTAAGAAVGLASWALGRDLLSAALARVVPFVKSVPIDWVVVGFAVVAVALVGALAGLVPALWVAREVDGGTARRESRRVVGPRRLMVGLVALEVAATFVMLISAGLLSRSLGKMMAIELGYQVEGRVVMPISLPLRRGSPYLDPERHRDFFGTLLARARAIPGVTSVGLTTAVPLRDANPNGSAQIRGEPSGAGGPPADSDFRVVSPDFFATLGIPLLGGRVFAEDDGPAAPNVVVVSREFARVHLRGENPVGRMVRFPGMDARQDDPWATIVGMVGDTYQVGPTDPPRAAIYYSYRQRPQVFRTMSVVAVTPTSGRAVLTALEQIIAELEPNVPAEGVMFDGALERVTAAPRVRALVLGMFAATALALAGVGLFGVIGFVVLRRTRELGLRMALGASSARVAASAARQALLPVVAGIAAGALAAVLGSRLVRGFLFQVEPLDGTTYLGAVALIVAVSVLACVGPVRRTLSIDPATSLRAD